MDMQNTHVEYLLTKKRKYYENTWTYYVNLTLCGISPSVDGLSLRILILVLKPSNQKLITGDQRQEPRMKYCKVTVNK